MTNSKILNVSQITKYLKNLLEGDSLLSNIALKGEISNLKVHSSGHIYFSLKDDHSSIKCIMFRNNASRVRFEPKHGTQVLVWGYVSVFEQAGMYQLYVQDMVEHGSGDINRKLEDLKEKLRKQGIFSKNKRKINRIPNKIGIVSSTTGAALKDILAVLKDRNNNVEIVISPATVQGIMAPDSIVSALNKLYSLDLDTIILARGGGSVEDLWCFNEEKVVRAISRSPVPLISAIGHETDNTLSDLVADIRAATPSNAAEIAVLTKDELKDIKENLEYKLKMQILSNLDEARKNKDLFTQRLLIKNPLNKVNNYKKDLKLYKKTLVSLINRQFDDEKKKQIFYSQKISSLNPLFILEKGYTVSLRGNELIKSSKELKKDDVFELVFFDGKKTCKILK